MIRFACISVLSLVLVTPVLAQDFRAENGVMVRAGEGEFTVLGGGGFGARGLWCAAADFSRDVLGAKGTDRIYVKTPRSKGTGQNDTVGFSLSPAGLTPSPVTFVEASLRRAGANLSVDHAGIFCADSRLMNR